MGHVDHGKTTLLDSIRKSTVAQNEAGGITQHIGAFSVQISNNKTITFLDTPGHAAFSEMRTRGANITDIVVLVVAADDGVMPQTIEAIKHANAANVPIIVAINKIDKHQSDPKIVKHALLRHNVILEEFGGDVQAIEVSALKKTGLDKLEEAIIALSEILELKGDSSGLVEGVIIESKMGKGTGPVATIMVKRGTLSAGNILVAGNSWCKVKRMCNEHGSIVKTAGPSTPVEVLGWKELPEVGSLVLQTLKESIAKKVIESRINILKTNNTPEMNNLNSKITNEQDDNTLVMTDETELKKTCKLIIKSDVNGSLEALLASVEGIPCHEVNVQVLSSGVGPVTESDVELAKTFNAIIFTFNTTIDRKLSILAEQSNVMVCHHTIIYNFIDEIKEKVSELLEPEKVINVKGEGQILARFELKGKQTQSIAGCKIQTGKITKTNNIRIIREGEEVYDGRIETFKHLKKEISEASKGLECGIGFESFDAFQCIVKSYLQWLQDSDFDPNCAICKLPLAGPSETVRLLCLDLFHIKCLNDRFNALPNTTAPAGYTCLSCNAPVIPSETIHSPLSMNIRSAFKSSPWAQPILESISKNNILVDSNPIVNLRTSTKYPPNSNSKRDSLEIDSNFPKKSSHTRISIAGVHDADNDKYNKGKRVFSWVYITDLFQGRMSIKKIALFVFVIGCILLMLMMYSNSTINLEKSKKFSNNVKVDNKKN